MTPPEPGTVKVRVKTVCANCGGNGKRPLHDHIRYLSGGLCAVCHGEGLSWGNAELAPGELSRLLREAVEGIPEREIAGLLGKFHAIAEQITFINPTKPDNTRELVVMSKAALLAALHSVGA